MLTRRVEGDRDSRWAEGSKRRHEGSNQPLLHLNYPTLGVRLVHGTANQAPCALAGIVYSSDDVQGKHPVKVDGPPRLGSPGGTWHRGNDACMCSGSFL